MENNSKTNTCNNESDSTLISSVKPEEKNIIEQNNAIEVEQSEKQTVLTSDKPLPSSIEKTQIVEETKEEETKAKKKKGTNFDLNDYLIMMLIGSGNFSEIYMVEHKATKILYSMKSFQRMRIEQLHKQEDVLMEKHIMEKIKAHKNIIGYYGSTKDNFCMYILYEYINGGDLWKRCIVYGLPSEKLVKFYFVQLLHAIQHMHSFNIPHRDIKPENILITKDEMVLKVIDFGSSTDLDGTEFSKQFEEERNKQKNKKPFYKHFVGTPNFMAPECVHNQYSDKRADYWSLGCVLYNMFTGFPPFLGASEYLIFQKSIEAKYLFPEGIVSLQAEDLIRQLIVLDPDKRLNIDQMLNHPYLIKESSNEDFLKTLPIMTPEEKEYYDIRMLIYNKYIKFKQQGSDLESIKRHEDMEEDLRRNEITPEPNENDKIMKELVSKKESITQDYNTALEECINEIAKYKKEEIEGSSNTTHVFNCKLSFLTTQIKHDIFNIIYRGYEPKSS